MYGIIFAFGLASSMLCIGVLFRSKLKLFQSILIPASVAGGILGFIIMNFVFENVSVIDINSLKYNDIIDVFFTFSFISIGLTKSRKESNDDTVAHPKNSMAKGIVGMALIWCILYAATPVIGSVIIALTGKPFNVNAVYGMLIPFAFCQGPGQATTYGRLFENVYGYENAEMIALTFAVIGFFVAFLIGIPFAKYGIEKGLTNSKEKISKTMQKGYFPQNERFEIIGRVTTCSSSIDTLTFHFAIMGVCYLLESAVSWLMSFIPGIGSTFSAMNFFWGLIVASFFRKTMEKCKIDHLIDDNLQTKITNWLTDYLVVCSFMAVRLRMIGKYLLPILIVSVICTAVTIFVTLYFSARLGSDHDFERFLGIYGTCTGTVPCGIALLRIADPQLRTGTDMELGMMNIGMTLSTPIVIFIMMTGLNKMSLVVSCVCMLIVMFIYCILLKSLHILHKPTFTCVKAK